MYLYTIVILDEQQPFSQNDHLNQPGIWTHSRDSSIILHILLYSSDM